MPHKNYSRRTVSAEEENTYDEQNYRRKKLSEKYYFVMDKKNPDLLKLSKENVALAEFLVRNDSAYTKTSIKTAVPTAKYHGSTAYWFSRLKEFCQSNQGDYAEIILGCIIAVDNENGTHLNADHIGREVLKNRIVEWGQENLLKSLKERDFALVKKLAERTGTQEGDDDEDDEEEPDETDEADDEL